MPTRAHGMDHLSATPGAQELRADYTWWREVKVSEIQLFLSGDVMTGRGIDQILAHPGDPTLYEPSVRSAVRYGELAEWRNGPIPGRMDRPTCGVMPWRSSSVTR